MKHIAHVLTFAAALAALAPVVTAQDPQQELAAVIAVEEQERDLAKAEKGYREAIAGGKLSKAALRLAEQRLGRLLKRIGRDQEGDALLQSKDANAGFDDFGPAPTPQDVEREKALREKAKGLVQEVIGDPNPTGDKSSKLFGVRSSVAEQLLWIGQPAVPVVIAALEDLASSNTYPSNVIAGLAGFLWRTGGPQAAEFLKTCAKQGKPQIRGNVVRTAYQANRPEMLATVEAFLDDPDPEITFSMLQGRGAQEGELAWRLDAAVILAMAERGTAAHKAFVLDWGCRRAGLDPAAARRLVQLVRQGFASTDPAFGAAARKCLESRAVQSCVEGIELLLGEAPKLRDVQLQIYGAPEDAGTRPDKNTPVEVSSEIGKRLWPQVFTCLRTLDAGHAHRKWVTSVADWVLGAMGSEVVPDLLVLVDAGYTGFVDNLWFRVTAENAATVLSHLEQFGDWKARRNFLINVRVALPEALFPLLRDKVELQRRETPGEGMADYAWMMARTGHPEAADWITAEWQRRTDDPKWAVGPLLELGRRTQHEKAREAMRVLQRSDRLRAAEDQAKLVLALLSMHDVPALEFVAPRRTYQHVPHPYADKDATRGGGTEPLDYLFASDPQPPHGFTEDELFGLLGKLAATNDMENAFSWQSFVRLTPRLHGEVVRLQLLATPQYIAGAPIDLGSAGPDNLRRMLASTVLERARTEAGQQSPLRDWAASMLREPRADIREAVLSQLHKSELEPQRALVETFLDGDDEGLAVSTARVLGSTQLLFDPARLVKNRHPGVRQLAVQQWASTGKDGGEDFLLPLLRDPSAAVREDVAEFFGARVSKPAVPDLIALLRDPAEPVRKAAADALTRIRFFHEQQAHWERVLKGLDATPASAAEKLLLQAKPGAPKAQRLLAVTSLGTLGVPEALPFLIEWTADPDAELAAAAKAAITQIHLNPRK